ncbi:MAG TPA: peptidylprolyl isomerase [Bryobacteraceae bacterium]|nr:peptidylprolyl isomerase [Bryobacteraceae bacterium]
MIRLVTVVWMAGALMAQTPEAPKAEEAKPARENGLYAVMTTSQGVITLRLFEKEAPITVRNFTGLVRGTKDFRDPKTGQMVKRPFFTGVTFHRVIPGFMIQGGDPTASGMYDAGYTIPDEFVPTLKFDVTGRLAMANTGEPHTGSTQFFITDGTPQHLNGKHTIFGQVVEGQDVVTKIANVPRGADDKPKTPVKILSIKLERVGPPPAPAAGTAKKSAAKKAATPEKK